MKRNKKAIFLAAFAFAGSCIFTNCAGEPKNQTSANDKQVIAELKESEKMLNATLPRMIDSVTNWDEVKFKEPDVYEYYYTILNIEEKKLGSKKEFLQTVLKNSIIENYKDNAAVDIFRINNMTLKHIYRDKNKTEIFTITLLPGEY
ncbi:hypothetical protein DWQ65_04970 [Treponema phagedenis]|uniref:Lipoprotein n=1 Tax=Treponema phagedenis TaxID=162 RepID=A0A0B7GUR7_TREPH|nr:hypothetical protein [Treponema phagedenis]NVP23134.1 hypothetical protein [Treponema phagedenis]QEJ95399.1 hypothetical protein FUT79_09405 [Treponema phagedenis]QEJ98059.1 hypothetical protein FUT82_08650 [Treponema phagedenis]QEK01252.1 hypothetical protein FUT84_08885 [Treponema phagedenis]QEK03564.1 hypothetical protein FUT83_06940 [Treponema phagedenis]